MVGKVYAKRRRALLIMADAALDCMSCTVKETETMEPAATRRKRWR